MGTMELEETNCYPGCIPEFGAIFMSNTRTKVECFRRKLFGLPSGQAPFVRQIKAGMVLFLFEFERRELHGVYQSSTDGAMNIVPHAFSSSGKQFPAQVKFTHLWHCSPLSEDKFREAIKENYFSATKFNFGLSEDQVHKLLYLFSWKKLRPQRHVTKHKASRYFVDKFSRAADDQRSITSTQGEEADGSHGPVISTNHFGARLGNDGIAIDDGRFATSARLGDDGAVYPGQFDPSSTFCRPMEPQAVNFSCPTSTGDAIVESSLPYDPDDPDIESRHLSSYEHCSNPVQNFASPHSSKAENVLHLSENQSFLPYTEPRVARCPDFSSVLGYGAPVASPNHYGNSQRTRMPFLEASYSQNMAANPSGNEDRGFSLQRPGPILYSDSGNSDGMYEGTSYSFSASQYPSFVFDYRGHEASQEKNVQKMLQCGVNLKECKSQLQGPVYAVKSNNIYHIDNSSLKLDDVCKNFGGMYSDCQKNQKSVFSRLALAPKARIREYDTFVGVDEDSIDTSVEDVMSILHQSHYRWLKMKTKRQLIEVDTTDFRKKRQTTSDSKLLKDHFEKISDEVRMNDIPSTEETTDEFAENTNFVDFKRRSELRKIHDNDCKIGGCRSAESEGCAGGLHKKRKLIRPNFSKNELTDVKSINVDTPKKNELLHVSSHISHADNSIEADIVSNCKGDETVETSGATFSNLIQEGKELSQNVDIGTIPSSISKVRLTNKNSVGDGLSQDLNSSTHSFQQDSLLEAQETNHNGIASGEIECFRITRLYPNADLDVEVAFDLVNDSRNQTPKSERACEEVIASGCKGGKVDTQQIDDGENAVPSSGCEIITGQCQTTTGD